MHSDAIDVIRDGGVIAYPTEAVYGLGCDPRNEQALQRIIDIKGRDAHKGFILIASTQAQLAEYMAPVETAWQRQLDAHWPGPFTFIVPAADTISDLLSGYRNTLAVRVSAHPVVRKLCDSYGGALVSTSANRSGMLPLTKQEQIAEEFGDSIDVIVDGALGDLATPTRIIDVRDGSIIR